MYNGRQKMQGFTIIELMITLLLAGVLASIAAPSFRNVIQNNRMTTQYNDLLASLSLARSEAIKRGENVTACKASNPTTCGGNWHNGRVIFVDNNDDGTIDAGEEIIRVYSSLSGNNTLNFPRNRVTYSSNGLATGFTGTFTLCDDRGDSDRKGLVVSNTGRVRHAIAADVLAACP